jgi:hypothetical protein
MVGGRPGPFAEWPKSVPWMGWIDATHRTVRDFSPAGMSLPWRWEVIDRQNLYRASKMLMTLLGFLWALAIFVLMVLWIEPASVEKMFRLVRRPVLVTARPARRFLSSALPWWHYSIMAPPRPEPTQLRSPRFWRT